MIAKIVHCERRSTEKFSRLISPRIWPWPTSGMRLIISTCIEPDGELENVVREAWIAGSLSQGSHGRQLRRVGDVHFILRTFRGVHKYYLADYVATYETIANAKRITPTVIRRVA